MSLSINFSDPLSDPKVRTIFNRLRGCRNCKIGCGICNEKAEFYGGKSGGIMMVLENPGLSAPSIRHYNLRNLKNDSERVAITRHAFFYWFNNLLSKLKDKTRTRAFRDKTFFHLVEHTLTGIKSLKGKVDPDSIYITDICKACSFALPKDKTKAIKDCAQSFPFRKELLEIDPILTFVWGDSAYQYFYTEYKSNLVIKYPPNKINITPLAEITPMHGSILVYDTDKFIIPFLHPSQGVKKYVNIDGIQKLIETLKFLKQILP